MVQFAELDEGQTEQFSVDRKIPLPLRVFYAYDGTILVGYFIAKLNPPFSFCDTCPGNCISGAGLWVDPSFRNQGIFKSLYNYSLETIGTNRVYSQGHGGIQGVPYLNKYNIKLETGATPQTLNNEERLGQLKIALGNMDELRSLTGLT